MCPGIDDDDADIGPRPLRDRGAYPPGGRVRVEGQEDERPLRGVRGVDTRVREEGPILHAEQEPRDAPDDPVALPEHHLDVAGVHLVFFSEPEGFCRRLDIGKSHDLPFGGGKG